MLFAHSRFVAKVVGALLLMVCGLLSAAEIRYVSDQLTLKMYKDSALSQIMPLLKSGDRLEVLKRDDGYAQVKKDDGTVGWVKSKYLEKDKPAVLRLIEVQQELDALRSEHTDLLIEQPDPIEGPNKQLQERAETAEASQQNMKLRMKELESERMLHIEELRKLRQQEEEKGDSKMMLIWVILPLLMLISGFFIGFKYLEGKIKARFGGYNPL
jgi:SH3 domain protein